MPKQYDASLLDQKEIYKNLDRFIVGSYRIL